MFEASLVCIAKYRTTRATQGDSGGKKKNRILFKVLFNLEKERETERERVFKDILKITSHWGKRMRPV